MAKDGKNRAEKTISWFYIDTYFGSIKQGIYSDFLIPFALFLGATSEYIAIVSAAPKLIGSFIQLFSSDLLNIIKTRKRVIIFSSLIDALTWFLIMFIPFFFPGNYILFLNLLVLQAIAMYMLNPFFNSLLGDVVPQKDRPLVIGKINKITAVVSFISSLFAGFLLNVFGKDGSYMGFVLVFALATISRLFSTFSKLYYYEPKFDDGIERTSVVNFAKGMRYHNFGRFVMYSSSVSFATGMSGPFYVVYMLNVLNFDFFTYSLINGAVIISSFLILDKWGRRISNHGSRNILSVTAFLIATTPIIWIFIKDPKVLFFVQLYSGIIWSGHNLSKANFVLDATTSKNRLAMSSYYHFFEGLFTFLGAMTGGYLMQHLPAEFLGSKFLFIFGFSALLRLIFAAYFIPGIAEERFIDVGVKGPKAKIIVSITPRQGVLYNIVPRKFRGK